jgi:hypothetical protein
MVFPRFFTLFYPIPTIPHVFQGIKWKGGLFEEDKIGVSLKWNLPLVFFSVEVLFWQKDYKKKTEKAQQPSRFHQQKGWRDQHVY